MPESAASNSQPDAPQKDFRVLLKVVREKLSRDDILLRASALAYSTLASLVPIFAIILAILSGPTFDKKREAIVDKLASAMVPTEGLWNTADDLMIERIQQQEEFKHKFESTIRPIAEQLAAVSIFGFLILLATVWLLFQATENAFNAIWRATSRRPFFLRVAIATSMMFWGPVMLAVSISLSESLRELPFIGTYILPGIFSTLAFTAFFMLMPHAKVDFTSALIGGTATALLWEFAKTLFVFYVTHVVSYSAVYGSLGLIPMLFLWVYLNWLVILYGAELAYCFQHRNAMVEQWLTQQKQKQKSPADAENPLVPASVILATAIEVARRFRAGCAGGVRASDLAKALHIETGMALHAAQRLISSGILARVAETESETTEDPAYLPAYEPTACDVSMLLSATYDEKESIGHGESLERARTLLFEMAGARNSRFSKMTLADLAADSAPPSPAEGCVPPQPLPQH